MLSRKLMCPMVVCLLLAAVPARAATFYVNGQAGADSNDGTSPQAPFKTIQKAADRVTAGDTAIVMPGLYYEHVRVTARGTAEKPITFMTDAVAGERVVVTGADRRIREKGGAPPARWTLEDKDLLLYSAPFSGPPPARVLASRTDLYPYGSLTLLKNFIWLEHAGDKKDKRGRTLLSEAGPPHGYFFDGDAGKLYVRLERSGRFGPTDPNEQTMCVSPTWGGEYDGTVVKDPSHYNFGVLGVGPAYVVIDGFTCETPGVCGVYVESSNVTVRNCWFYGCRSGVGGTAYEIPSQADPEALDYFTPTYNPDYSRTSNNVTMEFCEFTQFPTYTEGSGWARKITYTMRRKYETGAVSWAGKDWEIRHCYIHDMFDGLSSQAVGNSWGLKLHDNRFEGLVDNFLELEDHSREMVVYHNVVVDDYHSPLSWQPLKGPPWPGPAFIYENVFYNTPEHYLLFPEGQPFVKCFTPQDKRPGATAPAAVDIAAPGLLIFNNTVIWPRGGLMMGRSDKARGYHLWNNIIVTDFLDFRQQAEWSELNPAMEFRNNLCAPSAPYVPGAIGAVGDGGRMLKSVADLKFYNPRVNDYRLRKESPAVGRAVEVPNAPVQFKDIGALQSGDDWFPPKVGPQPRPPVEGAPGK